MTDTEQRGLDAWIAEHVFKGNVMPSHVVGEFDRSWTPPDWQGMRFQKLPEYSTDPAAAMEVLKKCVEFLSGKNHALAIVKNIKNWRITESGTDQFFAAEAQTLELAICLFAKKLFSK